MGYMMNILKLEIGTDKKTYTEFIYDNMFNYKGKLLVDFGSSLHSNTNATVSIKSLLTRSNMLII